MDTPWMIPKPARPPGTPNQGFVALLQRLHIRLPSVASTRAMLKKKQKNLIRY